MKDRDGCNIEKALPIEQGQRLDELLDANANNNHELASGDMPLTVNDEKDN